jgi:hypothetical protein
MPVNATSTLDSRTVAVPDGSDRALAASRPSVKSTDLPVGRGLAMAYRLSVAVAALVGGVSAAGLVLGPTVVYGSDAAIAAGIATSTAGILVPGFFAHDLFNLAVALPLLLATLWAARRGSTVGLLVWPGTLFYVLYTYTQYLLGAPFGPLFLAHSLLVVLSAYATIALLASIDGNGMRRRLAGAVPARTAGGILVALALLTIGQDAGGALATAVAGGGAVEPLARSVWTADLAVEVPAVLAGGVLLWQRRPLGYAVGAGLLLQFGLTPVALAAILALQPWLTGAPVDAGTIAGVLIFAAVPFAPLAFFIRAAGGRPPFAAPGAERHQQGR